MSKGKILVVDDENYILHILDFSLGAEGYEVITAEDGEAAVRKAKEQRPDLIVLDVMMPKMDGFEACRMIKRDPDLSTTPVILLSAKARDIDQKQGYEAGADDYITKPFSPGRLVDRVQGLLRTNASG
jgi:two-component system alkaline phosphatase synthesis response regulator PhoP